jgi:LysM repeat protein
MLQYCLALVMTNGRFYATICPMNRRQLAFVIVINALISLAVALSVAWVIDARRPDPEELAIRYTPPAASVVAAPAPVEEAPATLPAEAQGAEPEPTATTPQAAPGADQSASVEEEVYIVQAGDSLGAIAGRFGVSVAALVEANNLANPDYVFSGQRLVIPVPGGANPAEPAATPTPTIAAGQGLRIGAIETPGNLLSEAALIVNDSNLALNLQGWRLEREGGPVYTFGSTSIFPGSRIWVHTRSGDDTSVALYWDQQGAVWQSGVTARLVNPQGEAIATYQIP